jgi:hypothetical protein
MYDIEMQEMSQEFFKCWQAAGIHLSEQVNGDSHGSGHPYPLWPASAEHRLLC